jgi:hypothetical protein
MLEIGRSTAIEIAVKEAMDLSQDRLCTERIGTESHRLWRENRLHLMRAGFRFWVFFLSKKDQIVDIA